MKAKTHRAAYTFEPNEHWQNRKKMRAENDFETSVWYIKVYAIAASDAISFF